METCGNWSIVTENTERQDLMDDAAILGISLPPNIEVAYATDEEGPCPVFFTALVPNGNGGEVFKNWLGSIDSMGILVSLREIGN